MIGKIRNSELTLNNILSQVGELDILSYYFDIPKIPCLISSPLRTDNNPSFRLYSSDGVKIKYNDYGTGEYGDTFNLLQEYWGLSFVKSLEKVYNELTSIATREKKDIEIVNYDPRKTSQITRSSLDVVVRSWKDYDLEFWNTFGINKEWLEFSKTYPISHVIITKDGKKMTLPADKHAYVYIEFKDGKASLKVYQPFSEKFKWTNKRDSSVWDLWVQLPKTGRNLIITSSRKDALCLWANTGIPSCSLQNEGIFPKPQVIQELKDRFENIFLLYDNDYNKEVNKGRVAGGLIAETYNLKQIEIHESYKSKDPSDLYKNKGLAVLKDVVFKLIKDI